MNLAVMRQVERVVRSYATNRTVQQGSVLLAANTVGNLLQYVFHAFVSRAIGPQEYGVFASLLALYIIVSVPATIAQTVITQYVSRYRALNEIGKITSLLVDGLKYLSLAGVLAFVLVAVMSIPIASFLNVPSSLPVVAMASIFLVAGGSTIVAGTLQGMQRFFVISANGVFVPVFRLISGVLLIALGWGAIGALGASTLSTLLAMAVGLFFLRDILRMKNEPHGLAIDTLSWYTGVVLLGMVAYTVLTNIDIIVVKHFFSPEEAGYYSAASVLGKIILFFPAAVSTLMFPKTSHRFALGQNASDLVRKSVLIVVALCGSAAVVLAIFPSLAVHLMFGNQYDGSIGLVGLYGATMGLYAVVQLLMTFYLSQEEARFVWLLGGVTAMLAITLAVFHVSLAQVILSLAASALAVLVLSEMWLGGLGIVRRSLPVER